MSTLLDYDREDVHYASQIDSEHTKEVREVLRKFIKANYIKYSLHQLTEILGVTPAFVQEQMTQDQRTRCGRRSVSTLVILRDIDKFEEDKDKWQ